MSTDSAVIMGSLLPAGLLQTLTTLDNEGYEDFSMTARSLFWTQTPPAMDEPELWSDFRSLASLSSMVIDGADYNYDESDESL